MTLTFNLPNQMSQMALFLLKGNNCAKLFWNPCIIVQVMVQTNPDGCTDARTYTEQNCNNYVSITRKRARKKVCLESSIVVTNKV